MRHKLTAAALLALLAVLMQGCKKSPQEKEAAFLRKGEALVAAKQYTRAILEFRNAIRVRPQDAEPYYRLGIAYLDGNDVFDAFRAFHRATELNPKHSQAQLKVAELLNLTRKSNLLQDAATRLGNVLLASPNDEEATDALAITEFQLGNKEDAAKRLEESLRKFPSRLKSSVALARILLLKKDFNGAEEALKKAVAIAPDSSPARLAIGQLYILLGHSEKAEPEIAKAVQLDSKNGPALLSLALLQMGAKRMDAAEATLKQLSGLPDKAYRDLHAMFLYKTGNSRAAISELERLVRDDPENRATRSKLLLVYQDANRTQDAEKLLAASLKRNPKDTDALFERSQLDLKNGRPRQAEQDLDQVLHSQSNSARAHFALARVYVVEGLGNRERQELNEALRFNPGLLAARLALAKSFVLANQPQAAMNLLDGAPERQKRTAALIEWRNWALLQAGNAKELRSSLNEALRVTRTPQLVLQDGLLKMREKDYEGARADAEEVLKLKPNDSRGARLLADTYIARNEAPKATERLAEIAAAGAKTASMQALMGEWYMRNGQTAEARKAFEAALARDPNFISAAINLAEIDRREHRADAARQRLQGVLGQRPGNIAALLLLAGIDEESGDRAGEIAAYKSAIGVDSSNVYALNNLAYALAPNNLDEALPLAERAVEIAPENAAAQDTLGGIYYRKQMYGAAVDHLRAAVNRDPSPRREFHLAMSYLKAGRPEAGKELLRNALKQDPNLPVTERGW